MALALRPPRPLAPWVGEDAPFPCVGLARSPAGLDLPCVGLRRSDDDAERPLGDPTLTPPAERAPRAARVGEGVLVRRVMGDGGFGDGVLREAILSVPAFTGLVRSRAMSLVVRDAHIGVEPSPEERGVVTPMVWSPFARGRGRADQHCGPCPTLPPFSACTRRPDGPGLRDPPRCRRYPYSP